MIVAERKPFSEILEMVANYNKILVVGCGTCVTVCYAGGEKEVGVLASSLRMARATKDKEIEVLEATITRQCEYEYVDPLKELIDQVEAVISMGCGIGVQTIAERFPDKMVYPALNTKHMGLPTDQGVWAERCAACGQCVLHNFGAVCPVARCSKSLLNGPCGGSEKGKCEVDPENIECGWQLIYDRLKQLNRLDLLETNVPPKDWSTSRDGGVRRVVREDMEK
mgnify:CR=1 FL=1